MTIEAREGRVDPAVRRSHEGVAEQAVMLHYLPLCHLLLQQGILLLDLHHWYTVGMRIIDIDSVL